MKKTINNLQIASIFIMLMMSSFLGLGVFTVIKAAGVDSYISIIISAILGLVIFFINKTIFDYEPQKTFFEKVDTLFNKQIAFVIKILVFLITILFGIVILANIINFISSQFLRDTSPFIITLIMCLLILFLSLKKDTIISKVSFILIIINIFLFFTAVISLIPGISLDNLKPVLANGLSRPFKGSVYICLLNVLSTYLILGIPKDKIINNEKTHKYFFIMYIIAALFMLLIIFITVGVLGIDLASLYEYPEYIVLKKIKIFNFLNQVENIINIQWIFGIFINLSVLLSFCSKIIKKKRNYLMTGIITILLVLSLVLFKDSSKLYDFIYNDILYFTGFILLLLIIIFLKVLKKNKQ